MIKNLVGIVLLSIVVVVAMPHLQVLVSFLVTAENWVGDALRAVFSGGEAGNITRELIALLVIPFVIGLVPAIIYWFAKKSWFPYFWLIVWVVWLVEAVALILSYKPA